MTEESMRIEYNGAIIRWSEDGGEDFLNMTDMWKASGSDPNKKPADWLRKEGKAFVDFIAENKGVPVGHILRKQHGNPKIGDGGSMSAHWQIGLAYAKYLSHEFHAYCNNIIKSHIEGRARDKELEQFVRTLPASRGPQWGWDIIDLFATLYNKPKPDRSTGCPPWFRGVVGQLHKMRFPPRIIHALKELSNATGARYHEHMQDPVLAVLHELQTIALVVGARHLSAHAALQEIADACNVINGLGAQVLLIEPPRCKCGNKVGAGDKFCSKCGAKQ
jgi:hypothetical protein